MRERQWEQQQRRRWREERSKRSTNADFHFFVFILYFCSQRKMASLLGTASPGGRGGSEDLASLLARAKAAGLAHERELALLAGRSALARSIDADDIEEQQRGVSPPPAAAASLRDWCRHALSGALDTTESSECRRCVWKDSN